MLGGNIPALASGAIVTFRSAETLMGHAAEEWSDVVRRGKDRKVHERQEERREEQQPKPQGQLSPSRPRTAATTAVI